MQRVALIDYGSGNLRSAEKALVRAADGGSEIVVTCDPDVIAVADRVVLPGVGAFAACMGALEARDGVVEAMTEAVHGKGAPFLGICVGMQLMASRGLEFGETPGLDWIAGDVRRIEPDDPAAKVPHMGWNRLVALADHPLTAGRADDVYFTHSFAFFPKDAQNVIAQVEHGGRFPAAVARGNVAGVQFHPEKSQAPGLIPSRALPGVAAMILYPAIDLKDGECVRVLHGDLSTATVFNTSPAEQAQAWADGGFHWLHVVDLNGAVAGKAVNEAAVEAILGAVSVPVQLGGGIRSLVDIERWIEGGVSRVILGTVAVTEPRWCARPPGSGPSRSPSASTCGAARWRCRAGPRIATWTP
jgi:glutamine amidotransferase